MVQIEEIQGFNHQNFTMIVYGEAGVGKTRFASTFPDPVFIDADFGMASVTRKVARIPVRSWDELRQAYSLIKAEVDKGRFKTVVIDTLNEVQAISLRSIITQYPGINRPYGSLASESDYGKMLFDFEAFLRSVHSGLNCIKVFLAQVAPKQYSTDTVNIGLIGKSTARNVARIADIIGYMYRQEEKQAIAFNMDEFVTKDRTGRLPPVLQEPDFEKLIAYFGGNKNGDQS